MLGPVVYYKHNHATANAVRPNSCPADTWSQIDSSSYIFEWDGVTYFRDGPGGSMSVSNTVARQISATISASASISTDELVVDVKVDVSASATTQLTTTTGHIYNHNITAGKYGNVQYGAWGYNVHWSRWRQNPNCTSTELDAGTGTVPTTAVGWNYWEN